MTYIVSAQERIIRSRPEQTFEDQQTLLTRSFPYRHPDFQRTLHMHGLYRTLAALAVLRSVHPRLSFH